VHQADPEAVQPATRALAAALDEAGGEQERVDGAGAGAADGVECDRRLLEEALQHAPCEGGKRAAALQGERQFLRRPVAGGARKRHSSRRNWGTDRTLDRSSRCRNDGFGCERRLRSGARRLLLNARYGGA
jgi:hypothetical protein